MVEFTVRASNRWPFILDTGEERGREPPGGDTHPVAGEDARPTLANLNLRTPGVPSSSRTSPPGLGWTVPEAADGSW